MSKEISITYAINVIFERKFHVNDDFVLKKGNNINEAFETIAEKFPEQYLKDLDETNCDSSPDYYGQDPFELYSIEIINLESPL